MTTFIGALGPSYRLELDVNVTSQSIENNTSTVAWVLRMRKLAGSGSWSFWNDNRWTRTINGVTSTGTRQYDFRDYDVLTLASGTQTIAHNADGTRTISVSASWDDHGGTTVQDGSLSGSLTLPTIPRASVPTLSASSVDAGTSVTINTNRVSSSFTHTVSYSMGAASGVIATGVATSVAWSPPLALLNQIPNATSGSCVITVETYNGATLIGTRTITLTVRAAADIVPDFTTVTHSETVAIVASEVGAYVQSRSALAVAITGAVGAYGSTITSHRITVAGQTINAASGTTAPLGLSGTLALVGTVTDSRGRTRSRTVNIDVLPYSGPAIDDALFFVRRSDAAGTLLEEGTYLRVDLKATVASLINGTERNRLRYKIYTRERGTLPWTTVADTTLSAITYNSFIVLAGYPIENSYDVLVEVLDDLASTASITRQVATAAIFMHWGEGLGLGKFWENGQLDVAGDGYFSGVIYQAGLPVIDTGDVATETVAGIIELATSAETITGTDVERAVTPAALAALTSSSTRRGLVELATNAEAQAGTDTARAVTPAALASVLSLAGRVRAIAAGDYASSTDLASGGGVSISVTFPAGLFTSPPRVTLNPTVSSRIQCGALSVTTSGFTARLDNFSGGTATDRDFNWIAVEVW